MQTGDYPFGNHILKECEQFIVKVGYSLLVLSCTTSAEICYVFLGKGK